MIKKTIVILAFLFLVCPDSYSQSGKRDGIHKEFYKNGKLRLEYMVKNERFSGFYEKYDENGDLEYRQYYIDGIFDGTDRDHYYYPLYTWYHHIGDKAEEIMLDNEDTLKLFGKGYAFAGEPFGGNRMGIIRMRVPVTDKDKGRYPVILSGISKNYIYLKEFKERTDAEYREHHYYDLVRKYKIERDRDIDDLFNVHLIEEVFKRRHTGIEFGSSNGRWRTREGSRLLSVQQYFGEPEYSKKLKPSGWFDVYYEDENLHIIGHSSAVYVMEEGRPDWANSSDHKNTKD